MKIKLVLGFSLTLLAIIFAIGLTFGSVELPRIMNSLLLQTFNFPGFDSSLNELNIEKTELFIQYHHIRLIGYICLSLVIILIVVGFITNRGGLSSVGAVAFFLPVFGHFAMSMFFLAGLGILRLVWMPFLDVSFDVLGLGDITYVPYMIIVYIPSLFGFDIRTMIPYVLMGLGILIFVQGTIAWFFTKFQKKGTADFWVYRISRHPQYLGWIIWSYGFIIYLIHGSTLTHFKLSYGIPSSLPWLLSTIVIIGIAMNEEIKMKRERGEEYESYRRRTPFMLPLPRFVSKIFAAPIRFIFKKEYPERKREIAVALAFYTVLLIMLSVPFKVFNWPRVSGIWGFPYNVYPKAVSRSTNVSHQNSEERINELVKEFTETVGRKNKYHAAEQLAQMGNPAVKPLIELLKDNETVVREFSAQMLGEMKSKKAVKPLIKILLDKNNNIRSVAASALGEIQSKEAIQPLISCLEDENGSVRGNAAEALGKIGSEQAVDALITGLKDKQWYVRITSATALGKIKSEKAAEPLIETLKDENKEVRQAAVLALSKIKSEKAVESLIEVLNDEDWEVQLYAAEALLKIGNPKALKAVKEYKKQN